MPARARQPPVLTGGCWWLLVPSTQCSLVPEASTLCLLVLLPSAHWCLPVPAGSHCLLVATDSCQCLVLVPFPSAGPCWCLLVPADSCQCLMVMSAGVCCLSVPSAHYWCPLVGVSARCPPVPSSVQPGAVFSCLVMTYGYFGHAPLVSSNYGYKTTPFPRGPFWTQIHLYFLTAINLLYANLFI